MTSRRSWPARRQRRKVAPAPVIDVRADAVSRVTSLAKASGNGLAARDPDACRHPKIIVPTGARSVLADRRVGSRNGAPSLPALAHSEFAASPPPGTVILRLASATTRVDAPDVREGSREPQPSTVV